MTKKVKERTCVSCGKKGDGTEMLKWVVAFGKITPDWFNKLDGRSVYSHFDKECLINFFTSRKLAAQPGFEKKDFFIPQSDILSYVKKMSRQAVSHFMMICIKSGVVLKGQNLIAEQSRKGKKFKYLAVANDVSPRTVAQIEKVTGLNSFRTKFSKSELGSFFDGRPAGIVAFNDSHQTERLFFYIKLFENVVSGEINADQ